MSDTEGMSDVDAVPESATDDHADHVSGHGHAPAAGEPPGPVDLRGWAYAVMGGAVGLVVAVALFVARGN